MVTGDVSCFLVLYCEILSYCEIGRWRERSDLCICWARLGTWSDDERLFLVHFLQSTVHLSIL